MRIIIDESFYHLLVDLKSIINSGSTTVLPFLDFENVYYKRNELGKLVCNIDESLNLLDESFINQNTERIIMTGKVMVEVYDHDVIYE